MWLWKKLGNYIYNGFKDASLTTRFIFILLAPLLLAFLLFSGVTALILDAFIMPYILDNFFIPLANLVNILNAKFVQYIGPILVTVIVNTPWIEWKGIRLLLFTLFIIEANFAIFSWVVTFFNFCRKVKQLFFV